MIVLILFFFLVFPACALGDEIEDLPEVSDYLGFADLSPDPVPAITDLTDPDILELLPEGVDPASVQRIENIVVENLILKPEQDDLEAEIEPLLLSEPDFDTLNIPTDNCLVFKGRFNNQACYLIFPQSYIGLLTTTNDGVLLNVSTGNLTGRIFYQDTFSASDYRYNLFTLASCLTSTGAQQINRNGSASYMYTYTGGTNQNIYGNFYVTDVLALRSDTTEFNNELLLIGILLFSGSDFIFSFLRIAKN